MRNDYGWRVDHDGFQKEVGIDLTPEQERTINDGLNDIAAIERSRGKAQGAFMVIGTGLLIAGIAAGIKTYIDYKAEKKDQNSNY